MTQIQAGIRTPGIYTGVNINTQRTGLPANEHKVLFLTKDNKTLAAPVSIYDAKDAETKILANSDVAKMITAAIKSNRLVNAQAMTMISSTEGQTVTYDLDGTLDVLEPLGHSIYAVSAPPAAGDDTEAWIEHLDFVSGPVEQREAILVVPFADIDDATTFAAQLPLQTSYRVIVACYHGATGQLPQIAGAMAAILADSNDPAMPFNGVNLGGVDAVDDSFKLTFERQEAALRNGVCVIATGADGKPEIVRAISTFRKNPDSGLSDDIMLDINGVLTIDYVRKVMRTAASKERRRKNTAAARRNLRSIFLAEALKLDRAEILQNVEATADQLTVTENLTDRTRVDARIPSDWVRGMHVVGVTLDVY